VARADLARRFRGFLGVGAIGFLVDVGAFTILLHGLGVGAYASRGIAFALAVATTYALNRGIVWRARAAESRAAEGARYLAASLAAGACNLATYAAIVAIAGTAFPLPHLALAAGVGVGLLVNFALYEMVVFRGGPRL
jgi:putative flippase GtrA